MGCPPLRGDNPRASAKELSHVEADKHGITIYTTYISVDLAHHEIVRANVGKGGILIKCNEITSLCGDVYNGYRH